jgi:uncharacterized protein (TIGR02246 family)
LHSAGSVPPEDLYETNAPLFPMNASLLYDSALGIGMVSRRPKGEMMNHMPVKAAFAIISLVSVSVGILPARAQSKSTDADSAAIRQSVADFIDAFNHHDAHAWASFMAEDGDFTNVTGLYLHGRKDIEKRFTELFATRLKDSHRTATVRHIRFISPDVAFVDAEWELAGSKAADGSENPVRKGLFNFVMTRQNGRWIFPIFEESEFAVAR